MRQHKIYSQCSYLELKLAYVTGDFVDDVEAVRIRWVVIGVVWGLQGGGGCCHEAATSAGYDGGSGLTHSDAITTTSNA